MRALALAAALSVLTLVAQTPSPNPGGSFAGTIKNTAGRSLARRFG